MNEITKSPLRPPEDFFADCRILDEQSKIDINSVKCASVLISTAVNLTKGLIIALTGRTFSSLSSSSSGSYVSANTLFLLVET